MEKVFLVANAGFTLTNFRKELILKLKELNYNVCLVCPKDPSLDTFFYEELKKLNVSHIEIQLNRKGINPFRDGFLFLKLFKLYRQENPSFVLNYTIKPVIYSSLAAKLAGISSTNSFITGLGYVFTDRSRKAKTLKNIVNFLYKLALRGNNKVFFQNPDDLNEFLQRKLIKDDQAELINGSGVNLKTFYPTNGPKIKSSFVFIGRLLKDKGIFELIEAIKMIKKTSNDCHFYICGSLDESNPNSLSKDQLAKLIDKNLFAYVSHVNNVADFLKDKEVFILPSYREGTPRAVLEAMAMGMPIITTDVPGCRETTKNNINGFIIPPKNSNALYEKILTFIEHSDLISKMGNQSLQVAKEKYDVEKVNQSIIRKIGF